MTFDSISVPPSFATSYQNVTVYPAISTESEYIPIHSIASGESIRVTVRNTVVKRAFSYGFTLPHAYYSYGRVGDFCTLMESMNINRWATFFNTGYGDRVYIGSYGTIAVSDSRNSHLDDLSPTILMTLAVKQKYLFDITPTNNTNLTKFALVIDRKFITDENHFKLYRNIKRSFIDQVENKIDIIYTNDLMRLCFNNSLSLPRFRSINEMVEYTNSMNSLISQNL